MRFSLDRLKRYQDTLAVLCLFALAAAVLGDLLFSPVRMLGIADLVDESIWMRRFGFFHLRHGRLPLWNPHLFSGTPFFGSFVSALLYPPNWIFMVLPLEYAVNFGIALHVFLAGAFTYFWCRRRGSSASASFLAGMMFMLSGPYYLHTVAGHLTNLCAMAWAPLILASLDGWIAARSGVWCLLGAFAVCMQILAGHPQYVYYTGIAAILYVMLHLVLGPKRPQMAFGLPLIYFAGACLSAVQLFTGAQTAAESLRSGGTSYAFASMFSFPPENISTLFVPYLFGDLNACPYFGRWYLWEACLFVSVAGLALAIHAVVAGDKKQWGIPLAMIFLLSIAALGAYTPIFPLLHRYVPLYGMFRGSAKFSFLIALFAASLAATGFDRLQDRRWPGYLVAAAVFAAFALMGLGYRLYSGALVAFPDQWGSMLLKLSAARQSYFPLSEYHSEIFVRQTAFFAARQIFHCATVLLIVSALLLGTRYRLEFRYGLVAVALVELCVFARQSRKISTQVLEHPASWEQAISDRAAAQKEERVLDMSWQTRPNRVFSLGLYDLWGYLPIIPKRYAEFMAYAQGQNPDQAKQALLITRSPAILDMLRCRYVFTRDARQSVLLRRNPMPRLQLIRDWSLVQGRDAILKTMLDPHFDPRRTVILESRPEPSPGKGVEVGTARLLGSDTDSLEIQADLPHAAILLITDGYSAGWRAVALPGSIQARYQVLPADYVLRAIPMTAGRHHLRVEYVPWAFRLGRWVSGISLLLYSAACLSLLRRFWRRRSGALA